MQWEGWSRPELSRRIYLIPQMLGVRQKRFGKDQMRIKAKTIKNIWLLFLKQDPKAFKEICKWYWIDVNVVGKKQMHNQFFFILFAVWVCKWVYVYPRIQNITSSWLPGLMDVTSIFQGAENWKMLFQGHLCKVTCCVLVKQILYMDPWYRYHRESGMEGGKEKGERERGQNLTVNKSIIKVTA